MVNIIANIIGWSTLPGLGKPAGGGAIPATAILWDNTEVLQWDDGTEMDWDS